MEKRDFSDWLIVSDVDGTITNKARKIPLSNFKAVDRFVNELSGNFTLGSARGVQSLRPHYQSLPGLKTPAIILNGAGIYDYAKEKMLWFNPVGENAVDVIKKAMKRFRYLEIGIFTENMIYLVRPRILSPVMMMLDSLTHKKCKSIDQVPKDNWGKVIFFCLPWEKKKIRDFVVSVSGDDLAYTDTTAMSFDLLNKTTNKGAAVRVLAGMLGVPMENTGAIGDYYNDLDMFRAVEHPACCKDSPEEVKKECEYYTCNCNDGAVADFLGYIENKC